MGTLAELVVSIVGDTAKLREAFNDVNNTVAASSKSLAESGKQLSSIGKTATAAITLPLVGIAAMSVKSSTEFESSMLKVKAVSGATGKEFEKLRELALDLGASTVFSAQDAAEAMNGLAMAGFNVNETMDAMPGLLSLAAATGTDLGTTADITSNILRGFGMNASEAGHMADVLALASASANTDLGMMGEAMKYVAPVAAGFGMSMEEAAATVGMLSNAGIQASMAGTTLRGIITTLGAPTASATKILAKYGVALEEVNPETHSLAEIVKTLGDAGLSTADAMEIFGDRAGPGMLALLSQGSDGLANLTDSLVNADGKAKEMADTMNSGTAGAMEQLSGAIDTLMISMGDIISKVLVPMIKGLTIFVDLLNKIPTPILAVIVALGGIVAAIGPVLLIIGTAMSGFASLSTFMAAGGITAAVASLTVSFGALGGILSTVVGIITGPVGIALAALAAAAYIVYKNWDIIGPVVSSAFDAIKQAFEPVIILVKSFISGALEKISAWWSANGEQIKTGVSSVLSVIGDSLKQLLDIVVDVIEAVLPWVLDSIGRVLDIILNTVMLFVNLLSGNWEGAWGNVSAIMDTVVEHIEANVGGFVGILDWLMQNIISVETAWRDAWAGLDEVVLQTFEYVISAIASAIDSIVALFKLDNITKAVSSVMNNMKKAFLVGAMFPPLIITGMLAKIIKSITGVNLFSYGKILMTGFGKGVSAPMKSISSRFNSFSTKLATNLKTNIDSVKRELQKFSPWIKTTIFSILRTVEQEISRSIWKHTNNVSKLYTDITDIIDRIATVVISTTRSIIYILDTNLRKMVEIVSGYVDMIYQAIHTGVKNIILTVQTIMSNIITSIKNDLIIIYNTIVTALENIVNRVKSVSGDMYDAGSGWIQSIIDGVKSKLSALKMIINNAMSLPGLSFDETGRSSSGSSSSSKKERNDSGGFVSDMISSVKSGAGSAVEAGQNFIGGIADGIRSGVSSVVNTVKSTVAGIRDYFPFSPAKVGPLKKLPNWDAFFIDPILKSTDGMEKLVENQLSGLPHAFGANQVDGNMVNIPYGAQGPGAQAILQPPTPTETHNIGGNTLIIQNMTLSKDYPFEQFMRDYERKITQTRVQRGIRG